MLLVINRYNFANTFILFEDHSNWVDRALYYNFFLQKYLVSSYTMIPKEKMCSFSTKNTILIFIVNYRFVKHAGITGSYLLFV